MNPISLTTTDLLILPPIVIGWVCVGAYGVTWCVTWGFFKARDRFIRSLPENEE